MDYNLFCLLLVSLCVDVAFGQQTGTLKARFVYGGEAVAPKPIEVDKDKAFCGEFTLVDERLLVNAEDKGIRNVIFHLYTGRGGYRLELEKRAPKTVSLTNEHCRFEPHIIVLQAGDTLEVVPNDQVGHNENFNFFANNPSGMLLAPRTKYSRTVQKPEPGIVTMECNIHPWERAYAAVLDHTLVDVSDEHGTIEIEGLPAGVRLPFRLFHEAAAGTIKEVIMEGKPMLLDKNRIELEIKPGMNDFGTITIPQEALKP